ncbi:MAG: hypothetical protein IH939_08065 [Acidobacteria bacterium]|nr:hypothetical protein [Acidobacteriota bacterium]
MRKGSAQAATVALLRSYPDYFDEEFPLDRLYDSPLEDPDPSRIGLQELTELVRALVVAIGREDCERDCVEKAREELKIYLQNHNIGSPWYRIATAEFVARLVDIDQEWGDRIRDWVLDKLVWFNSRATVSDDILKTALEESGFEEWEIDKLKNIVNVIPGDDLLMKLIIEELGIRRGVDWSTDRVALISESDTFYGGALPDTFVAELANYLHGQMTEAQKREAWTEADTRVSMAEAEKRVAVTKAENSVIRFKYLRGLDGAIPGHPRTKSQTSDNGNESTSARRGLGFGSPQQKGVIEAPFGRGQFDYLRRLVGLIREKQKELREKTKHGEKRESIRVIGVLGSDVFDKQLILQALRREFQDILFFTTDLDEQFSHPDQYRWNRNLLIASGFGTRLHPKYQGGVLPFRDAYQTATYLATRLALNDGAGEGEGGVDGDGEAEGKGEAEGEGEGEGERRDCVDPVGWRHDHLIRLELRRFDRHDDMSGWRRVRGGDAMAAESHVRSQCHLHDHPDGDRQSRAD